MAAPGEGKSLKVVFIHPSANPRTGGIVKAGLSYIRGLRARGHDVEVWTSSPVVAAEAGTLVNGVVFDAAFESWIKVLASPKLRGAVRPARFFPQLSRDLVGAARATVAGDRAAAVGALRSRYSQ